MQIAVIGGGISGLGAAYVLGRAHDVTLFEAAPRLGGHAKTVDVEADGRSHAVDTGFVVFNETTYPNFTRLLSRLGVDSDPTSMSFSVRCEESGLEYCGTTISTLFAQRRNLLRPSFYRLLADIVRFNRQGSRVARDDREAGTLGGFLETGGFSERFRRHYLVPLVAAIWSMDPRRVEDFPSSFFLRFMARHRLLQASRQLPWRVIRGGSRSYVERLVAAIRGSVRTGAPVRSVRRFPDGVEIRLPGSEPQRFDEVVLAVHSDQALRMLADPTDAEREILGAIPYQENEGALHDDVSLLPVRRRAWANWNYRVPPNGAGLPVTTYSMSGLQGLPTSTPICITLNDGGRVDPARVVSRETYAHPVYDVRAIEAQTRRDSVSGTRRTHFCGAYWGAGFHEDGLGSALDVARRFGLEL